MVPIPEAKSAGKDNTIKQGISKKEGSLNSKFEVVVTLGLVGGSRGQGGSILCVVKT